MKKELERIKVEDEKRILQETHDISEIMKRGIKKKRVKAEVFVGGSLAKGTLIKKDKYDIDIFIRFKDDKNASDIVEKILKGARIKADRIHGSRDYFSAKRGRIIFLADILSWVIDIFVCGWKIF